MFAASPYRKGHWLATPWEERELVPVANFTRQDGLNFLSKVPDMGIIVRTTTYPLERTNEALADLRAGSFEGAAVLVV